jgi:ApaG protein
MTSSEACTRGVRVHVDAEYVPDLSSPAQGLWLFGYTIRIRNESSEALQLLARHWHILDATGHKEEVRGRGVVGEQPVIEPGDEYVYSSRCILRTPSGSMRGTYLMTNAAGEQFEANVAPFELMEPKAIH